MKKEFTPQDKINVAIEALKGLLTNAQISSKYSVHPIQIGTWKKQAVQILKEKFSGSITRNRHVFEDQIERLHTVIGKKEMELDWLKKKIDTLDSP